MSFSLHHGLLNPSTGCHLQLRWFIKALIFKGTMSALTQPSGMMGENRAKKECGQLPGAAQSLFDCLSGEEASRCSG